MHHPEPTASQLDAAWRELAASGRHASCSNCSNLDEAMAKPVAAALIRMHARLRAEGLHPLRDHLPALLRPAVIAPDPPAVSNRQRRAASAPPFRPLRAPQQPALFDRKRAASGERDDD